MEKLFNIKIYRLLLSFPFLLTFLTHSVTSIATQSDHSARSLEEEVSRILVKTIKCKKVEVQIKFAKEKAGALKSLAIKFDDIILGPMMADHMTLIYEDPVIDLIRLKKEKEFKILSYSKNKVGILISAKSIEAYLEHKAKQFEKKYNRISIKFSPPYLECLFDVPASEVSPETLQLVKPFVKNAKLEGYAAFRMEAKDNALYASSSKVIVNHFLVPERILRELQNRFNPFDAIPTLHPFQYSMNHVTVQNQYIFLSN